MIKGHIQAYILLGGRYNRVNIARHSTLRRLLSRYPIEHTDVGYSTNDARVEQTAEEYLADTSVKLLPGDCE